MRSVRAVLAVELVAGAQAIDFRAAVAVPGTATRAAHELIRAHVPPMDADREVAGQLAVVDRILPEIVAAVEGAIGVLD